MHEEVATLLAVQPAQKQNQPLTSKMRKSVEESLALDFCVGWRRRCSQSHHFCKTLVRTKRLCGERMLFFTREQDSFCVPQDPMLGESPEQRLLDVLEGIRLCKPGIEHAVSEQKVRRGSFMK